MRKLICAFFTIILLLGGTACAEERIIPSREDVNVSKLTNTANNPAIEGESPLTGLPAGGEAYTPIMLPMDNSPEAHPLWGIGDASILFQVPLKENGATRLLALFGDRYPEQAGGVRSGRMSMLPLAAAFHAVFAYAGLPPIGKEHVNVEKWLGKWSFQKPSRHYNLLGLHFRERVSYVKRPGNLSAHVSELHEHLAGRDLDFEMRPFLFTDEPANRDEKASVITVQYHMRHKPSDVSPNSTSTFTWKPGTGYIRSSISGDMTDRTTGETVPFANVIIMRIPVKWEAGYPYYEGQMCGSGQADIFQSGCYIQGAWIRDSQTERLVFLDENGKELEFQRGKTFIVLGEDMIVSCSD